MTDLARGTPLADRMLAGALTGEPVPLEEDEIVPASVLRDALVAVDARPRRWINLQGARIDGWLDLDSAVLTCGLRADKCTFSSTISMTNATSPTLTLYECTLTTFEAIGLQLRGSLSFSSAVARKIILNGAHVSGDLGLVGATIGEEDSQIAERCFLGDNLRIGGSIAANGLRTHGTMTLHGADIGGQCRFRGARLWAYDEALAAERLRVGHHVLFDERQGDPFEAHGEVDLTGAQILGQLVMVRTRLFSHTDGVALRLDGASIGARLHLQAEIEGAVVLFGADVRGDLLIEAGSFSGGPSAISAGRLRVRDDLEWTGPTQVTGSVDLSGAEIGGDLKLEAVSFGSVDSDRPALVLDDARVGRTATLSVHAVGEVRLAGAQIGASLSFHAAELKATEIRALSLARAAVADTLYLTFAETKGVIDLSDVRVRRIVDREASWPTALDLRGLRYELVKAEPDGVPLERRLAWIERQVDGYAPGPYLALAAAHRTTGHEEGARRVLIAGRRARRENLDSHRRVWDRLLDVGLLYGYAPYRAVFALVPLLLLSWAVFALAAPEHFTRQPGHAERFHALIYTLDVTVPAVDFGQRATYAPSGYALWLSVFLTFAGWALTAAVAAALSGLLQPERPRS